MRPSRWNRTKYRLWEEQGKRDIYTWKSIACTDLKSCEIDHIIPQSFGGSDSYANLALTFESANRAKSESSAYDFIQRHAPAAWPEIFKFISDRKKYPPNKAWRFLENAKDRFLEKDEDQTDHRLIDTSYMAKMALRYLSCICRDVVPLRGGMTAKLRHLWGLDGIEYALMEIPIHSSLSDEATGEVLLDEWGKPVPNPAWKSKPRIDQRHHAADALVLACASRSMMQKLAHDSKLGVRSAGFPVPFGKSAGEFRREALQHLGCIKPSPKAEHGLEGRLHEDTCYRILAAVPRSPGLYVCTYRRSLNEIEKLDDIKTDFGKHNALPAVTAILEENRRTRSCIMRQYELAKTVLEERLQEGGKKTSINEKSILQTACILARQEDARLRSYQDVLSLSLVNVDIVRQCGYKPGANFCMDFFEKKDGKVGWECISLFDANQNDFQPDWQKAGHKLLWRLFKDDVLEMQFSNEDKQQLGIPLHTSGNWFRVQKLSENKLQVKLLQDARPLQDKAGGQVCWVSGGKGLRFFTQACARKVDLSPFGKVVHKHKKLWDGKKTKKG